ncbi:FMN-binding protein [Syntrophomonas curvata]
MSKTKQTQRIIIAIGFMLLFGAFIYQHVADKQDTLNLIKKGEPLAVQVENLSGDYPSYKLWDAGGNFIGYGVIGDASGYGGNMNVTIIQENGRIKSVNIIQHYETPLYINKVLETGILDTIAQKNISDGIADVDAVSGASITRKAIITAVQKGTGPDRQRTTGNDDSAPS